MSYFHSDFRLSSARKNAKETVVRLFHQELKDFNALLFPRVDIHENLQEVVVIFDLPGLEKKEDVQVFINANRLSIQGEIAKRPEENLTHTFRSERFSGRFSREIVLPTKVVGTNTKATYQNGVLVLRMPKAQDIVGDSIDVEFK